AILGEAGGRRNELFDVHHLVLDGERVGALARQLIEAGLVDQHGDRQALDLEAVMGGLDGARGKFVVGRLLAAIVGLVGILAAFAGALLVGQVLLNAGRGLAAGIL